MWFQFNLNLFRVFIAWGFFSFLGNWCYHRIYHINSCMFEIKGWKKKKIECKCSSFDSCLPIQSYICIHGKCCMLFAKWKLNFHQRSTKTKWIFSYMFGSSVNVNVKCEIQGSVFSWFVVLGLKCTVHI